MIKSKYFWSQILRSAKVVHILLSLYLSCSFYLLYSMNTV